MKPKKNKNQKTKKTKTKTKTRFSSRIKNLFTLPEEDLKKEESPKFDKTKLFTLKKEGLFIGILLSMIIVNLLVIFDINFLYLRAILGFLFLIIIPGLLIMLCFKIRTVKFWEYLVYTIGLSVAFIMFAGLIVNWTLPALNITNVPLSTGPILVFFNIFLIALWIIAYYRNKDFKPFDVTLPKLDSLNKIFFIVPMLFPILSILGAFLLNNHGPNTLTMIMIGGIAVYSIFLLIFRKKLNGNIWPWVILMISLSLLLSFSIRSWFITGWDISQEQYVFRLTLDNNLWSMANFNDAYNSCLSITILPTIIILFLKANNQLIIKLFFQIIFVFNSLTIFLIFRKYVSKTLAFTASFLYFSTSYFNSIFPSVIRQEIAFLFFGLMLLVLFTKDINSRLKNILFIIFGASMIVSHYSTSYIALAMFTFTYILVFLNKIYESRKLKKGKLKPNEKQKYYLTWLTILFLLIFAFLWLFTITNTAQGLVNTVKATYDNLGDIFSGDLKSSSVKGALFGSSKVTSYTNADLNNYILDTKSVSKLQNGYSKEQTQSYLPRIANQELIYPKSINLAYFLAFLYNLIKYSIIISLVFGPLFILLNKKKRIDKEFSFMVILSVILMLLMILLPFISKAYNFERLFQQCLIFLSFSSIIFFKTVMKKYEKLFLFLTISIYLLFFLFGLGFFLFLSGGDPTLNLYNKGDNYNAFYSNNNEVNSISWLNKNHVDEITYMDPYSELKFYSFGDPMIDKDKKIIPTLMNPSSYVYLNSPNIIKEINYLDARERLNRGVLSFNFPSEFLNENKNIIYNNGGSKIFK